MGFISWILFGLIAGAIAKALHKGDDPDGWIVTIIIGIVGAVIGGAIGHYVLGWDNATGWNFRSFITAVVGAIIVLAIYRAVRSRRGVV